MRNTEAETMVSKYTNNIKENKGIYLSSIAFLLFISYIFSQRWFELVLKSSNLQIVICFLVLLLLLIRPSEKKQITFSYTTIDFIWSVAIAVVLIKIAYVGIIDFNTQFFMYSTGIIFLFLAKADIDQFKTSFLFIKYISVVYALATIVHYLFTDAFHSIIFPLVPYSVQTRTLELVAMNYYPGLGFAQPAVAAGYMIIGMGLILSFWEFRTKNEKILDIIYALILFLGITMVGKRSFILWGIVTVLVTYYLLSNKEKKVGRLAIVLFGIMLSLFGLFVILNFFESVPLFTRITVTINGAIAGEDITSGRTILYEGAWKLFKENPIFGIGWEQFAIITSGWFFSRDLSVHNVYLQLLTETGLVGFVAVIIPLTYTFYKTFRVLKLLIVQVKKFNYLWKVGITFSLYYQLFFLLYCLTENPFYNVIFMLMYFFSVSIVSSFLIMNSTKLKTNF